MTKGLQRSLARGPKSTAPFRKERISLDGITVTVSATGAAIGFGSAVIGDFPEGNILVVGVLGNIGFAGSGSDANLSDTWSGDFGIGTTPASDATITSDDVNLMASTAIGAASAEVIAEARRAGITVAALLDNTDGSLEINLNLLIDAADITDDQSVVITLSGNLWVAYTVLGDD